MKLLGANKRLKHALKYAKRGWSVFPHFKKRPCTKHGFKDATTDPAIIKEWWNKWPDADIGIHVGPTSGIVVLDVDIKRENGHKTLGSLEQQFEKLPKTPTVKTGSGGKHYYFKSPKNLTITRKQNFKPGLDMLCAGSVTAPPSHHVSGKKYQWINSPKDTPLAEMPTWLLDLANKPSTNTTGSSTTPFKDFYEKHISQLQITPDNQASGLCPFHNDKHPSFSANLENGLWHCFTGCGSGNVYQFAEKLDIPKTEIPFLPQITTTHYNNASGGGFNPIRMKDLIHQYKKENTLDPTWIWKNFIPVGGIAILAGSPKTGKTTFAGHLIASIIQGKDFLKLSTKRCKILWLGLEEHPRDIARRFNNLNAWKYIRHAGGPLRAIPTTLQSLETYIRQKKIGLVVVDTLAKFWLVRDENSAAETERAIDGILQLARKLNVAILLLHHLRKTPAENGENIRGSSAIFAAIDIAILLHKKEGTIRTIQTFSRYEQTPPKLTIELINNRYELLDEKYAHIKQNTEFLVNLNNEWQTAKEIAEKMNIPETSARRKLDALVKNQPDVVLSKGTGRQGKPKKYRITNE